MQNNTGGSRRPKWLNFYRAFSVLALTTLMVMSGIALSRSTDAPTTTEIAQAVNGPTEFQRPSTMEYVAKTNSCIVGGTVTSAEWNVNNKTVKVADAKTETDAVDYTTFGFKSDDDRTFTVSENGALFVEPGENLGLELDCEPITMNTTPSFGMIAIIWGGK